MLMRTELQVSAARSECCHERPEYAPVVLGNTSSHSFSVAQPLRLSVWGVVARTLLNSSHTSELEISTCLIQIKWSTAI